MKLPSWATHLAIDEDGEVNAFDRAPIFSPSDVITVGLWTFPTVGEGRYVTLQRSPRPNSDLYPTEVAERLCVSVESLPAWTTHLTFDPDGSVHVFDSRPVWVEDGTDWIGQWVCGGQLGRCITLGYVGALEDPYVARTLCLAISAPPEGPHTAT